MKHTTLRLPEDELRRVKAEAARYGVTLQTLLARGLRLALAELRIAQEGKKGRA